MSRHPARGEFDPIPSARRQVEISVTSSLPSVEQAAALAVPVASGAEPPADLGTDAAHLRIAGFTGSAGEHLVVPGADGRALVALGIGDASTVDETRVRDLAADFARAVPQHLSLAVELPEGSTAISPADFAQVVVEGIVLARWRYFVGKGGDEPTLTALTIIAPDDVADEVRAGADRGPDHRARPRPSPATWPTARPPRSPPSGWPRSPRSSGPRPVSRSRSFDEQQLIEMGCGGHPRGQPGQRRRAPADQDDLPPGRSRPATSALVGKGIMYDSGGISLKPSDESHAQMKNDMTGAAAILGAMTALAGTGLPGRRHRRTCAAPTTCRPARR